MKTSSPTERLQSDVTDAAKRCADRPCPRRQSYSKSTKPQVAYRWCTAMAEPRSVSSRPHLRQSLAAAMRKGGIAPNCKPGHQPAAVRGRSFCGSSLAEKILVLDSFIAALACDGGSLQRWPAEKPLTGPRQRGFLRVPRTIGKAAAPSNGRFGNANDQIAARQFAVGDSAAARGAEETRVSHAVPTSGNRAAGGKNLPRESSSLNRPPSEWLVRSRRSGRLGTEATRCHQACFSITGT
jgi:hypothetical protein